MLPLHPRLTGLLVLLLMASGCSQSEPASSNAQPGPKSAENVRESAASGTKAESAEPTTEGSADALVVEPSDEINALQDEDAAPHGRSKPVPTLAIGDLAPALAVSEWVQGEAVAPFESGQVYVVEFWATWCPPCRASMPHLSDLQASFGDQVRFIGISDEPRQTVDEFLESNFDDTKSWKEIVTYALALDQVDETTNAYVRASNQPGIPAAFIVGRDGYVEWMGHPMSMDEPLQKIVDGDWDREQAKIAYARERETQDAIMAAVQEIRKAALRGEPERAIEVVEQLVTQFPENQDVSLLHLNVLLNHDRLDQAVDKLKSLRKEYWDDHALLSSVAWMLTRTTDPALLDVGIEFTEQAISLTNDRDASLLETMATLWAQKGDLAEAIAWQTRAVEHGGADPSQLEETLRNYQEQLEESKSSTDTDTEMDTEMDAEPSGDAEGPVEDEASAEAEEPLEAEAPAMADEPTAMGSSA